MDLIIIFAQHIKDFFTNNYAWLIPLIVSGIAIPFIIYGLKKRSEKKRKDQSKFINIIDDSNVSVYQANKQNININQKIRNLEKRDKK